MNKLSYLVLPVLLAAVAIPPIAANAQTPPAPGGTAIVVADVSLTNVVSTEQNGVISGQFALQGKMGEQNNIMYGIEARDKNGAIVDVKKLGEEASIRQGEVKQYQFAYTVPPALQGDISILLVAETEGGLMLGVQELAHTTYQGTGSVFSCAPATSVSCTSTASTALTASYVPGSVFATAVSSESKNAQKGSTTSFAPALAPGNYFALVTDAAHTQTIAVPFSVSGTYGAIQNVAITDNKNGTLGVVIVASASSASSTMAVALADSTGNSCGSAAVPLAGSVITLSVPSSCTQGTATVTLRGADNTALATSVTLFSTLVANAGMAAPQNTSQTYLLASVFLLLLILAGIASFFLLRKKPAVPPQIMIMLLIAAGISGGAHHASAATYAIGGTMRYEPCLGGGSWKNGETGCTEPGTWYNAYTTSGTVTVPDVEIPGSSYTIGISDSISFPSHTTDCYYGPGSTAPCGSTNVSTDIYRNLPVPATPYNTCAGYIGCNPIPSTTTHVGGITYPATSGTITTTAPPSGTDILSFVQLPAAPVGTGCVGGKKGCWTYQMSYTNVQVLPPSCTVGTFSAKFASENVYGFDGSIYLGETVPSGGVGVCVGNCGGRMISITCTPTAGAQCVYNPPPPPGPGSGPGTSYYPFNTSTLIKLTCSPASVTPSCSYTAGLKAGIVSGTLNLYGTYLPANCSTCVGSALSLSCTPTAGAECVFYPADTNTSLLGGGTAHYSYSSLPSGALLTCAPASATSAPTVHIQFN